METKTKRVKKGDWRTLEWGWNVQMTAFFQEPVGATVKMRYGVGFLGFDGEKARLDGTSVKTISAGEVGALAGVQLQIRVNADSDVTYSVHLGSPASIPIPT